MSGFAGFDTLASLDYAKPLQFPGEIEQLCMALNSAGVRSYLEIGARYGGSFEIIMKALGHGTRGVAVDFPGGNFGDVFSAKILLAALDRVQERGIHVQVIFGPSQAPEVIRMVADAGSYDAVMIDADHAYDAVRADFHTYRDFARKCVIVHDIAAPAGTCSKTGLPVEVPRFWAEVKDSGKRVQEIVAPGSNMGIGIVWL